MEAMVAVMEEELDVDLEAVMEVKEVMEEVMEEEEEVMVDSVEAMVAVMEEELEAVMEVKEVMEEVMEEEVMVDSVEADMVADMVVEEAMEVDMAANGKIVCQKANLDHPISKLTNYTTATKYLIIELPFIHSFSKKKSFKRISREILKVLIFTNIIRVLTV